MDNDLGDYCRAVIKDILAEVGTGNVYACCLLSKYGLEFKIYPNVPEELTLNDIREKLNEIREKNGLPPIEEDKYEYRNE